MGEIVAEKEEGSVVTDDQGGSSGSSLATLERERPSHRVAHAKKPGGAVATDRSRQSIAALSLALLAVGLIGWAAGSTPARDAGFVLYALIGFGSAATIGLRSERWSSLAFSAPLGLTFVLLVGFVLVETRTWSAGVPLFAVAVAVAACTQLWELARPLDLPFLRREPETPPDDETAKNGDATNPDTAVLEAVGEAARPDRRLMAITFGLAGAGIIMCLAEAFLLHPFVPRGSGGILLALSPVWYVGLALIIASVVVGLVASGWVAGVAVATLQLALTLTPAIVYALPRYSWTFKHIGVVEYILAHGSVNPGVDIYQSWPALFAGVAWVCHALGIQDPTPIARWWPPVIDLAVLMAVQRLALRVLGNVRRSWLAAAIVVVGNMIGQDYFSPQAAGFLLAIAVFAAVYRRRSEPRGIGIVDWFVIGGIIVTVVVTHQLSPYMIAGATVILALFGLCRSRLVPIASFALAGVWALLHFDTVKRYFNFKQFGDLTTNVLTKGFVAAGVHKGALIRMDSFAIAADAAIIGVLAVVVLIQRRDKLHLAIALCAASGAGLFIANSYGNEGAFRVVMFALPWLAILCADWNATTAPRLRWLPVAALPVLLVTYLVADWGLDFMSAMRPGDLAAEQAFETSAPAGSKLYILGSGYLPAKSTARYDLFKFRNYPYIVTGPHLSPRHPLTFNAASSFDQFMATAIPAKNGVLHRVSYYVISASAPEAAAQELSLASPHQYEALTQQFLHSDDWRLVAHTRTAYLFRLVSFFGDRVRPAIVGLDQDGQRITADRGTWPSLNALHFSYQWELCNQDGKGCVAVTGAVHNSLELHAADIGHRLAVVVRATDSKGRSREALSRMTSIVRNPSPPVNVEPPTLVGVTQRHDRIVIHVGRWRSPDKLQFRYQWEVCASPSSACTVIAGRTKANLILRQGFVGDYVKAVVTATDQESQSTQASSPLVGPVGP